MHVDLDLAHQGLVLLGGVHHRFDRQVFRIQQRVILRLPVVRIEGLLEIAFAIEEADADEAQAEIAGGLGVVSGQNPEAAGRDGQRFMKAELR